MEKNLFDGPNGDSRNHPFVALNPNFGDFAQGRDFFQDSPHNGGYGYYRDDGDEGTFEGNIGAVDWNPGYRTDIKLGADFWPQELRFDTEQTLEMGNYNLLPQESEQTSDEPVRESLDSNIVDAWDDHFSFIGYPDFEFSIGIDDSEYVDT